MSGTARERSQAAVLPDGWSEVATQSERGPWRAVEGAPVCLEEARALVAAGLATTAQRRRPEGGFVLLIHRVGRRA